MDRGLEVGMRRSCADCRVRLCFDGYRCVFGVRVCGDVKRKEYQEDNTSETSDIGANVFYVLGGHGIFLRKKKGIPRRRQKLTATIASIRLPCSNVGFLKTVVLARLVKANILVMPERARLIRDRVRVYVHPLCG